MRLFASALASSGGEWGFESEQLECTSVRKKSQHHYITCTPTGKDQSDCKILRRIRPSLDCEVNYNPFGPEDAIQSAVNTNLLAYGTILQKIILFTLLVPPQNHFKEMRFTVPLSELQYSYV